MQHKKEAWWFYRFLSIFYDDYVNPLFWTEEMRDASLEIGQLDSPHLKVIDVGSGTGFTTQGIVKLVDASNVTCVDQSPHQMAKARKKPDLSECTFEIGDAENIPTETNGFDRYVSAGSIEYWPNPQKGIDEAFRVVKPGGVALMIGPLEPASWFSRTMANTWMLFPKEKEYREWFEKAGFEEIEVRYVKPEWHRSKQNQYGIAIAGRVPEASSGEPVQREETLEQDSGGLLGTIQLIFRVIIGSVAGFVFIPIAFLGTFINVLQGKPGAKLTSRQVIAFVLLMVVLIFIVQLIF